jgi:hypothetical protein
MQALFRNSGAGEVPVSSLVLPRHAQYLDIMQARETAMFRAMLVCVGVTGLHRMDTLFSTFHNVLASPQVSADLLLTIDPNDAIVMTNFYRGNCRR